MAFSGTQTAHIIALVWFLTVVELVSEKHCRAATIKKACPALGKNKAPLSPLSWFIKHIMKLIVSKLAYWPVWIAIVNRKSIVSVPTLVYRSIYYHTIYQYHSNLPRIFHSTMCTPSTKRFPLECTYYSMVFIALVYNSGSQNILINDWYECLHVLSK